jgi:hypothetical protein
MSPFFTAGRKENATNLILQRSSTPLYHPLQNRESTPRFLHSINEINFDEFADNCVAKTLFNGITSILQQIKEVFGMRSNQMKAKTE